MTIYLAPRGSAFVSFVIHSSYVNILNQILFKGEIFTGKISFHFKRLQFTLSVYFIIIPKYCFWLFVQLTTIGIERVDHRNWVLVILTLRFVIFSHVMCQFPQDLVSVAPLPFLCSRLFILRVLFIGCFVFIFVFAFALVIALNI